MTDQLMLPNLRTFFPSWLADCCNDSSIELECFYCLTKQQVNGQRGEWRVMRDIKKKVVEKVFHADPERMKDASAM